LRAHKQLPIFEAGDCVVVAGTSSRGNCELEYDGVVLLAFDNNSGSRCYDIKKVVSGKQLTRHAVHAHRVSAPKKMDAARGGAERQQHKLLHLEATLAKTQARLTKEKETIAALRKSSATAQLRAACAEEPLVDTALLQQREREFGLAEAAVQQHLHTQALTELKASKARLQAELERGERQSASMRLENERAQQQLADAAAAWEDRANTLAAKTRDDIQPLLEKLKAVNSELRVANKTPTTKPSPTELVDRLLPPDEARKAKHNGLSFGATIKDEGADKSVAAMHSKERRALIRVGHGLLTEMMSSVYAVDPKGAMQAVVTEAIAQDPDFYRVPARAEDAAGAMALQGIITQYRMAYKLGDGESARQALSLLVHVESGEQAGGIRDGKLAKLMAECLLEPGDIVKIVRAKKAGSTWGLGLVESVDCTNGTANVVEIKPAWLKQFCQANKKALHLNKYEASGKPDLRDPLAATTLRSALRTAGSEAVLPATSIGIGALGHDTKNVRCTTSELAASKQHVLHFGRGMRAETKAVVRLRMNKPQLRLFLEFLKDPAHATFAAASRKNVDGGIVLELKQNKHRLLKVFNAYCDAKKVPSAKMAKKQWYEQTEHCKEAKAGECECDKCLNWGSRNFDALHLLIEDMNELSRATGGQDMPVHEQLHAKATQLQLYLEGDFARDLATESNCGLLCMQHALSAPHNPCFRSDCDHDDGKALRATQVRWGSGDGQDDEEDDFKDWDSDCQECNSRGTDHNGGLFMCSHCNNAIHRNCLDRGKESQMKDHVTKEMGESDAFEYTCTDCRHALDSLNHNANDSRANELVALIHPQRQWTDAESIEHTEVSGVGHALNCLADSIDEPNEHQLATLRNLRHRFKEVSEKKCAYHAHLIQDAHQGGYRNDLLQELLDKKDHTRAYHLMDYLGKMTGKLASTVCTDAFAAPTISTHISTTIGLNPTAEILSKHKDCATFHEDDMKASGGCDPKAACAPDQEEFWVIHTMVFSDDTKQNGFKTLSDTEASIKELDVQVPWVKQLHLQSDSAVNYHHEFLLLGLRDIQTRIRVCEYNFSVAGMGKDMNDMIGSLLLRDLHNERRAGHDNTMASEAAENAARSTQHHARNATIHILAEPDRTEEVDWEANNGEGIERVTQMMNVTYEPKREMTFRLFRNIGPGMRYTDKQLKKAFGRKLQKGTKAEPIKVYHGAHGANGIQPKSKGADGRTRRRTKRISSCSIKNARVDKEQHAMALTISRQYIGDQHICATCTKALGSAEALAAHELKGTCTGRRQASEVKAMKAQATPAVILTKQQQQRAKDFDANQRVVCTSFDVAPGFTVLKEIDEDGAAGEWIFRVDTVPKSTPARATMQVKEGLQLVSIGGVAVAGMDNGDVMDRIEGTCALTKFVFIRRIRLLDRGYGRFRQPLP
jgi:hypothetical protein